MFKKHTLFNTFLLLVFFIPLVSAQDFQNYQPLKSSGKIPAAFVTASSEKYQREQQNVSTEQGLRKEIKEEFYLESSFGINELLWSGNVLFNDPVGQYVNRVADEVLKSDPALRKKLNFYVVKSAAVNAFATDDGSIFVNLGLIARLESEAQLAFILCHEITHYARKHVVEGYITAQTIAKGKGVYERASRYEKRLAQSNYSKAAEMEADVEGFTLFSKSKYSNENVAATFDMLKDSNLPYEKIVFDNSLVDNPYLSFPDRFFQRDTVLAITDTAEAEPQFSSHPAPEERKKIIEGKAATENNSGKNTYLVSQEDFAHIRKTARFELCHLYLSRANYIDALYHSLLLKKEYGQSKYVKFNVAKALYGIAKYENGKQKIYLMNDYDWVDWQGVNWYFSLEEVSPRQFTLLALTYCWNLKKEYPDDKYLKAVTEDLMVEMATCYNNFGSAKKDKDIEKENKDFSLASWKKLQAETDFAAAYKTAQTQVPKPLKGKKAMQRAYSNYMAYDAARQKYGYRLGIDKVVVVNPLYIRADLRKEHQTELLASEKLQKDYNNYIMESGKTLHLDITMLDARGLTADDDAEKFNDIALLNAWYRERARHDIYMISSNYDLVSELTEKYGTPYFVFTGAISLRDKKRFTPAALVGLFVPPLWPVLGYHLVRPNEQSVVYTIVFDLNQNRIRMREHNVMNMRAKESVLHQNIYYQLFQIKRN